MYSVVGGVVLGSEYLTFTRTVVRFVRDGGVVREVVFEPWEPFTLKRLTPVERVAYVAHLIVSGRIREAEEVLMLPPYLKLVLPREFRDEVARARLIAVVSQALDPEYRKKMLIRYLESKREEILSRAEERGVQRSVASVLLNRLIEEIKQLKTLDEVVKYERMDPVDYVASSATALVAHAR